MSNVCSHCGGDNFVKRGMFNGKQRYACKVCNKTFSGGVHSKDKRDFALEMYLNNVGIRKIGLFLGVYHSVVSGWIKRAHNNLLQILKTKGDKPGKEPDVIELDEIYTYVKKNLKGRSYGLLIAEGKSVLLRLTSETKV